MCLLEVMFGVFVLCLVCLLVVMFGVFVSSYVWCVC